MNKPARHTNWLKLGLGLWLCLLAGAGNAQERILSFDSVIAIAADGSMTVTETIRVQAEGVNIQRGIYRDFPTRYRDRFGNNYSVAFEVEDVTRDGVTENWRIEGRSNGVRVYIGRADVIIPRGEHEYRLRYRTDRQLGFFPDHDELYWNVTGNGWGFAIEVVTAEITLPVAVPEANLTALAYTGASGSTEQNYTAELQDGSARFTGTTILSAGEGLTVVLTWPKGIIAEPARAARAEQLLSDNTGLLIALLTLALSFFYLYRMWSKVGRDPASGVIFPHYEPPEGFSPASIRYISRHHYDSKAFTAAVVNLAVKGYLRIHQSGKEYSLEKLGSTQTLAPGEAVLYERLFAKSQTLKLENSNHRILQRARSAHRRALRKDYVGKYFAWNSIYLLPSLLVTLALFVFLAATDSLTAVAGIIFIVALLQHGWFFYLLQAPSEQGQRLMDKFAGFKLYLDVAEKDDLNLQHPPDMTPELFERYLPFAIALGVEQAWADKFARALLTMEAGRSAAYHPLWYTGNFNTSHMDSFAKSVGSQFNSAISSAATPPGSTSGTSGGFSGGGGGGGGGGGW